MASKLYADHLIPPQLWEIDAAAAASITISQFRFTLSFFLSVLAGALLRYVPTVKGRHLFSALSGFVLLYYPFGHGVLHALVTSGLTYLFMLRFRQHCGTLTWLVVFPYLIACHVLSASGMAWKEGNMDFTGAQMVATLKLIAAAMCYQDGLRAAQAKKEDKPQVEGDSTSHAVRKHGNYSERHRLDSLPSLLEFMGYVFATGNLLAGPFFEIKDYLDYAARKGDWDERDPKKRIPSPLIPGLARLVKGVIFAAIWARLSATYSPELMESDWWGTIPIWKRTVLMWVVGFTSRCKYYFAWAIAESNLIFSGLCFQGYSEDKKGRPKPRWTRYINARIRRVELSTSVPCLVSDWNVCTGIWLRYYVYERLTPPGRRPSFQTLVVTQTVSGIWHGVFPGYWLFFISSAFMLESSKVLYRYEQSWPPRLRHFPLWVAAKVLYTSYILNYCAAAFQVLSFKDSIAVWRSVYFCGHGLMLAVMLVGAALPPRRSRTAVKPQRAAAVASAGEGEVAASVPGEAIAGATKLE